MKKISILTMVFAMAITSQAISFKWGIYGGNTYFGGTGDAFKTGGVVATLVFLGNGGSSEAYDILGDLVNDPAAIAYAGSNTAASMLAPPVLMGSFGARDYGAAAGAQIGSDATDVMKAGSSAFGVVLTYFDGVTTWYNVSSEIWVVPISAIDITTGLQHNFDFVWTKNAPGTALTSGGGWTAVPEPATAALALAGLALLIRRRK